MENNSRYYVDWWSVRKSTIYMIIAVVVLILMLGFGGWLFASYYLGVNSINNSDAPKDSATIISFEGTVNIIRVSTKATERVSKTTYVQAGDTVQTQADGRAQIRMIDGSILSVRPNSTIVISDSSTILGGTSVRVKLDDGQINVKTEEQADSSNNVIEIKESENKILGQSEASFNINPENNQGEIRINRGGLETTVGGTTVSAKENEFISINNGKLASRESLLNPPILKSPSPSQQIFSNNLTQVPFSWEASGKAGAPFYQMQVAQSPFFIDGKMIAEKADLRKTSATISGLPPGTYFWRVRAQIESKQRSDWSEPGKFTIVRKEGSAGIEASKWDVEDVGGNVYIVRGLTNPGATVNIQGRETFAMSDGSFKLQVNSSSPTVVVQIYDEKGNRSQYSLSLKTGRATK